MGLKENPMKFIFRVAFTLGSLALIAGALGTVKWLQIGQMAAYSESYQPPPQIITAEPVKGVAWENRLKATGTVEAAQGIMVTAELTGKISRIEFTPGIAVKAGRLLLQQDVSVEQAQLRAAKAEVRLARKNLKRIGVLAEQKLAPKATFDGQSAALERAEAQVALIEATIAKKTLRAPFTGRIGVRQVDLGEVLTPGQPIATLQALDSVYVNFYLPQQHLTALQPGLPVKLMTNLENIGPLEGKISVVNPEVDNRSRNVWIQAAVENPNEVLRPGMYATVEVILPDRISVLAIPATAVRYAPYSDSVFVVEAAEKQQDDSSPGWVLRQQFVQLGAQQGDYVIVRQGLEEGQSIASTGVFKLRNGQRVVVDNRLAPAFELKPNPNDA
jgi:membrane fusion protein (multidrug efflux system)